MSNLDGGGGVPNDFALRVEIGKCDAYPSEQLLKACTLKKIRPLTLMVRVQHEREDFIIVQKVVQK